MLHIPLADTFIEQLLHISKKFDSNITPEFLFGTTGHGARFTLAMNTRTGKEIGHPSSHYIWDIVSIVEQCFPDAGIEATAYLGPGYATRARKTAAQTERETSDTVVILDNYTFQEELTGHLLYPSANGTWNYTNSSDTIDEDWSLYPFGPVVLKIENIEINWDFPANTIRYLIDTIERGEEPMEIRGQNDYSAVSGWKAYARWMQSFAVPLPQVQHEHLDEFAPLLLERRSHLVRYLNYLSEKLPDKPAKLITSLASRYETVVSTLDKYDIPLTMDQVRSVYFAEQKTQTIYKKLDTYLTYKR